MESNVTTRETDDDVAAIETALLLEAVYRRYGIDFREYAPASLKRRLRKRMDDEGLQTLSQLQDRLLHDTQVMERLLLDLSINVTAMFRDPGFYRAFREQVVPMLRTWPFTRIWHAGCATGEEVYSMAILLREEGLLERTRIYATDMNQAVLERARTGVFPLESMKEYTENYIRAGGRAAFSDYYHAKYGGALFDRSLVEHVVWARHNLATDRSFNEFHIVICRNVMIYFDAALQNRVHDLFHESLVRFGVLALGAKETVRFTRREGSYEELDRTWKLYRRID